MCSTLNWVCRCLQGPGKASGRWRAPTGSQNRPPASAPGARSGASREGAEGDSSWARGKTLGAGDYAKGVRAKFR